MSIRGLGPAALFERAITGQRRALGRVLTMVERGGQAAEEIVLLAMSHMREAPVVGITGAPGSGKSTLVNRVVATLTERSLSPAVLAVDPSSPLTGGAILGDRVRMVDVDRGAFVRSIATRGSNNGLALAIPGLVRVMDAAGYSPVLIETVGVGQVEVDVAAAADTTIVVVTPGMGDAVQANKAGLLEVGDIFVVNKADRPGARDARRDLELMLDLSHISGSEGPRRPPIVMTNSIDGSGIDELIVQIDAHGRYLDETGRRLDRRRARAAYEIDSRVTALILDDLGELMTRPHQQTLVDDVASGSVSPIEAARRVAALLRDNQQPPPSA